VYTKDTHFIDRDNEIAFMNKVIRSPIAEFVIVHGRRRIGKTEMLIRAVKEGMYFVGRQESPKDQLKRFSMKLSGVLNDDMIGKYGLKSWDEALDHIASHGNLTIVFDEFPYMVESDPSIPSTFQEWWDHRLSRTRVKLIFCGSSMSMMEQYLFNRKAALYGRRTKQLKMEPMSFIQAEEFFPRLKFEEMIKIYGAAGGTPAYLTEFRNGFNEGIMNFFEKSELLYSDAMYILREEVREPRYYHSILEAIAAGASTFPEIMNRTGLGREVTSKYLAILRDLNIIVRKTPVTKKGSSRKGTYEIWDNYFRFWFKFVFPNEDLIETGRKDLLKKLLEREYPAYLGKVVEGIITPLLIDRYPEYRIGRWWFKDKEIDIVGVDETSSRMFACEVKWKRSPANYRDVENLMEKAAFIEKTKGFRKEFMIISRNGFTPAASRLIDEYNITGWSMEDLEVMFEAYSGKVKSK